VIFHCPGRPGMSVEDSIWGIDIRVEDLHSMITVRKIIEEELKPETEKAKEQIKVLQKWMKNLFQRMIHPQATHAQIIPNEEETITTSIKEMIE
jgi:hypothetical protein